MAKRTFNPTRLYKLVKVIVLVVSIVAGLYGIWGMHEAGTAAILKNGAIYCNKMHPRDPKHLESSDEYFQCTNLFSKQSNSVNQTTGEAILIAILLPIVFFGSTKLYKYLFPIK